MTEQENGPVHDSGAPAPVGHGSPRRPALPPSFGPLLTGALSFGFVATLLIPPPFGLIVAPFGLIPVLRFIASGQRGVFAWGWVVFLLAAAVGLLPGDGIIGTSLFLIYTLMVVLPAVSVEAWQRFGWSEGRWAAIATLSILLSFLVAVATITGMDRSCTSPLDIESYFFLNPSYTEMIEQLSRVQGSSLLFGYDAGSAVRAAIAWLFPSLSMIYLIVVLFWVRPRLPMLGFTMKIETFEQYRSEEWLPACFIAGGVATLLLDGVPRWVAMNLLMAVLMLYFIHGLAIIRAHLARWIGRGWLVRWGVALLSLQMPLPLLLAALGLADSFHQLRPQVSENGRKP